MFFFSVFFRVNILEDSQVVKRLFNFLQRYLWHEKKTSECLAEKEIDLCLTFKTVRNSRAFLSVGNSKGRLQVTILKLAETVHLILLFR